MTTTQKPVNKCLNNRQLSFISYYLESGNGTEAALKAGYAKSRARQTASNLLNRPQYRHVQKELHRKQIELQALTGATAEAKRDLLWYLATESAKNLYVKTEIGGSIIEILNARNVQASVTAMAELNKMDGDYAVIKQKMELAGGVAIDHVSVLDAARKRAEMNINEESSNK